METSFYTPPGTPRSQWSSRFAFILASTGAAVGLGNIWKFPYMAGDNGGSAFVIVYLICVVLIGIPVMIAEMLIGRRGQRNAVNSLVRLAHESDRSTKWQWLGWWSAATLLLILSFYSVVAGWSLSYLIRTWGGEFNGMNADAVTQVWQHFLASPGQLLLWHTVFMFMTLFVVAKGVRDGIEKASRIMMPLLFATLIILVGYATGTSGFHQGLHFLFDPDFSKITTDVIISAMGHAFFTLAVGAGCMLIYGSYLSKSVKLSSAVFTIAGLDVLVALLTGMAIFPLIFTYHLAPQGGPGLMFETLPIAFSTMGGGQFFGGLFFLLLLFAAWTSSISMAEPLVAFLTERYIERRGIAALIIGAIAWTLGIASLLSFNVLHHVKIFHQWTVFESITDLVTNFLLPIGGLFYCIFAGWIMKKQFIKDELANKSSFVHQTWIFLIRFIAPIGILIILFSVM